MRGSHSRMESVSHVLLPHFRIEELEVVNQLPYDYHYESGVALQQPESPISISCCLFLHYRGPDVATSRLNTLILVVQRFLIIAALHTSSHRGAGDTCI